VDDYSKLLLREYNFLKSKHQLHPMAKSNWKFARLRPSNFPSIRISQLAMLLTSSSQLFSKMMEAETLEAIYSMLSIECSYYWTHHYQFEKQSQHKRRKALGRNAQNILIINSIVPFLFAYGKEKNRDEYIDKALSFIEQIPAEKNNITSKMLELGFHNEHALPLPIPD
jgi:hypothetical protein